MFVLWYNYYSIFTLATINMEEETQMEERKMQEVLKEFKEVWKSIIVTKNYNRKVEELAIELTKFKNLDLRTQEDLQFFQFSLIFTKFLIEISPEKNVNALKEIFNVLK